MSTNYYNPDELTFIQSRAEVDPATVDEYARMMADGIGLDPAEAVSEGGHIYVYDGNHRGLAAKQSGQLLFVRTRPGTRLEAEFLALTAANKKHGLKLTQRDKRHIIRLALQHPGLKDKSDREIARLILVDHKTVGSVREDMELTGEIPQSDARTGADGRTINTANIGGQPRPESSTPQADKELTLIEEASLAKDESEWLEANDAQEAEDDQTETDGPEETEETNPAVYPEPAAPRAAPPPPPSRPAPAAAPVSPPPPPTPKTEAPAAAPPPPPPPPPAPKPAGAPDWHLHVTIKATGICLATLTQAGEQPAVNLSTHYSTMLVQVHEALAAHVPSFNGKDH